MDDPELSGYIGASSLNNYTAELSGLHWALWYAVKEFGHLKRTVPVELLYDNLAAAKVAAGEWKASVEPNLVTVVGTMWKIDSNPHDGSVHATTH